MNRCWLLALSGMMACADPAGTTAVAPAGPGDSGYVWTRVLDSADWKKNYNFQLFVLRDTLWVFHPDGNWFSADGTHWTKSPLPNAIYNLAFLKYVQLNNAVYGLGHFEGNIERFTFEPVIYRTTDLRHWDTLTRRSNLPPRFFYHPYVYDNKIWITGGEDKNRQYADVWSSTDAIVWTKVQDNLPYGKRIQSKVVELNGKLYLLNNDVWTSADGLHWEKTADEIVKGQDIFGYAAVVFDNKIWLLGCNRNEQFTSNVLVSADGMHWEERNAPWSPRGGIAACVFKDKIYMTGGKYGGTPQHTEFRYSNDLWTFSKK